MRNRLVTVFGGTGFLGRHLVPKLAQSGYRVNVVSRYPEHAKFLRICGPTGRVNCVYGDIKKESLLHSIIRDTDSVINLVGVLYNKGDNALNAVHANGAENIAKCCAEHGVKTLIHVSALAIDKAVSSVYARSKLEGEKATLSSFPQAVILRPSIIYGPGDHFFNRFAHMLQYAPCFPLMGGGVTKFQPVYVGDVVTAICHIIGSSRKAYQGKIYQLGGPEVVSFKELMTYLLTVLGIKRFLFSLPFPLATMLASVLELLPNPPLTRDQVKLLAFDNVVDKNALTLADLGIDPTPFQVMVPRYIGKM